VADGVIILLAFVATALPLWMGRRYGLLPLASPLHLVGYFCAAGFLVKALVYPFHPQWAFYQRFELDGDAALVGATYLTLFVLVLCLGYRITVGGTVQTHRAGISRLSAGGLRGHRFIFGLALAVALLTFVAILRARGVSGLSFDLLARLNTDKQIDVSASGVGATLAGIKSFFIVPKCAFVLLLGHGLAARDWRSLGYAVSLAGVLVAIALVSGDRFELVELLAYAGLTYLITGGPVGARSVLAASVAGAVVLLLSGYMTALRGSEAGLLQQIVGSTYFLDFNAAVMVTGSVAPSQMLWGESYGWWSFGWVPRAWWPEKPAIDLGVYFKAEIMGVPTGGAYNVTGPGEAFINFGWWGLAVAPVLGSLYRWIEVALLAPVALLSQGGGVIYPLIFYPFIQATLQSSFSAFVVGAAAQAVLILMMLAVFLPRYRILSKREVPYAV
jgi:hypothetical protein